MGKLQGKGARVMSAAIAILAFGLATQPAAAAPSWTLVDIGTLGGPGSYGSAVSDNGYVVGCADAMPGGVHAFIYRDGVMRDLGATAEVPGNSCALAVNNAGVAAGRSASGELVVWTGSTTVGMGIHGDVGGMNNAGTVVGSYSSAGQTRAFAWRDGAVSDLGSLGGATSSSAAAAINARGDIVGTSNGRAFLYMGGRMGDLGTLGGASSAAHGINTRGQVVGMATNANGQPTPFLYDRGMEELPGGSYASAVAINARGQVVASAEGRHGYLITGDSVTYLDALPAVRTAGWRNLEPTGINEQGWIVGTGVNAQGDFRAFLLVPRDPGKRLVTGREAKGGGSGTP
jgi:probable HAF family extracellular repeat protein